MQEIHYHSWIHVACLGWLEVCGLQKWKRKIGGEHTVRLKEKMFASGRHVNPYDYAKNVFHKGEFN